MRKWCFAFISTLLVLQFLPASAAIRDAAVAHAGDQCLRAGKIAQGRASDGSNLVCMKSTLGSSKGELTWWYSKLTPIKLFEIIAPSESRNSDSPEVVASRSGDRVGNLIGAALKSEELVKDFSSKNFSGGSGTWALATFQSYKNRLATSFVGSQALINGLVTTKSALKLSESKAIAQLFTEYEAVAVPINSKFQTLDQLITEIKLNPKSMTFVGGSAGGVDQVFMAKIFNELGLDPNIGNFSPQNSNVDLLAKTLSDKNSVALSSSGTFVQLVASRKMRILGVASPSKLPWSTAKTLQQQNLNIIYGNWYGIWVPPLLSDAETTNFIHLLDVFQNSKVWAKALSDNYWSAAYVGKVDFEAQIEQQTIETRAILQQLGF